MEKDDVVAAFKTIATAVGVPLQKALPDGTLAEKISGHLARVMGAQWLASRGVSYLMIQLLGRWGSAAVLRYIQDAPLLSSPAIARQVFGFSAERLNSEARSAGCDEAKIEAVSQRLAAELKKDPRFAAHMRREGQVLGEEV